MCVKMGKVATASVRAIAVACAMPALADDAGTVIEAEGTLTKKEKAK